MKIFFGSVANRIFITLLMGILITIVAMRGVAVYENYESKADTEELQIAKRIKMFVFASEELNANEREHVLALSDNVDIELSLVKKNVPVVNDNPSLASTIQEELGNGRSVIVARETGCKQRTRRGSHFLASARECQAAYIGLKTGDVLKAKFRVLRPGLQWTPHPSAPLSFFLLLVAGLAYLVARMTTRPIRHLANAAGELGRDIDRPSLDERGPTEVRQAAIAFNAMQARIKQQIQHRTNILAAITHDLQTPLTRLRLRLEKVGDGELREKLVQDLGVMQSMVREGLDLARSADSSEPMQKLDIDSLLDSVCADAVDANQDATLEGRTGASVMAQPNTLRRCLTNLVDNAIKYGHHARLQVAREENEIVIRIRDAGPGVPADHLEAVFVPFFRLETSRSRNTGGTGLGLTIARNIAENHRGRLLLRNHPDGGLEAILRFPARS
ncbi:MAG: ATP-binding protein [Collimonas sp.]|uniref:ATP-binding protein n=1 Tax=Collimonas sp. TaxID=1963772 RepID=UPI00326397B9